MTTAIIGIGNIGGTVARHLVAGGERVVVSGREEDRVQAFAHELGPLATASQPMQAIRQTDTVILAVWFDVIRDLVSQDPSAFDGKVVIDPSNPVGVGEAGKMHRTLPEGVSAGSVIYGLLPPGAHYVKAFGTMSASSLATAARRTPRRAVLFYATDDDFAATTVERLIRAAGFDPVKAGGVGDALRIEVFGDLHDSGALNGRVLDVDEARIALGTAAV